MTAICDLDDRAGLLAQLARLEREIAGLQAVQVRVLSSLQALSDDPKQFIREEVATALRWSEAVTRDRMSVAGELMSCYPRMLAALREGRVTLGHAESFCGLTASLDEQTAALVADNVLDYAESHDVADFRRKVKREIAKADPVSLEVAYERAYEDRRVWTAPDSAGMAMFGAYLPAVGAAELMAALSVMASVAVTDDARTKDQRMADALVQLGRDVPANGGGCSHCGLSARPVGPAVQVTVALSTLLDLDDQPGELNGDTIPASVARQLAADPEATWRRLVTDEVGHLIDYGRTTYRPPAALHDHVVARDRRCRFPGCHRRAENGELDHVLPWTENGHTNAGNLIALCPRHHHLKHEGGWHVKSLSDGLIRWTSPTGQVHLVEPVTYPTDQSAALSVQLTTPLS